MYFWKKDYMARCMMYDYLDAIDYSSPGQADLVLKFNLVIAIRKTNIMYPNTPASDL